MKTNLRTDTANSIKKFVLRLPTHIHEHILITAKYNHRSMNAEIIHALHTYLAQQHMSCSILDTSSIESITNKEIFQALFQTLPEQKQAAVIALLADTSADVQ